MEILWILFALGVAVLYSYLKSPSVIGAAGERRVNATLNRKLDKQDYTVIEDLTLPTLQGTTQIDHIVLSRFGVFVIETKNMSGWIFGGENQARWTQVMRRHKSQFQNPLRQNYLHVRVVQDLLGIRLDQLENLVVFVGSAAPKTEMPWNVFWGRGGLHNYIASQRIVRFTDAEVCEFTHKLRNSTLQASKEQRRAHVQHVKEKVSQKETDLTVCPRCGEKMTERTSRKTGQTFFWLFALPEMPRHAKNEMIHRACERRLYRPIARQGDQRRSAASPDRPFVHHAAFSEGEGRQNGQSCRKKDRL